MYRLLSYLPGWYIPRNAVLGMAYGGQVVSGPRIRLASLWVSQVSRVLADWCLRIMALLAWSAASGKAGDAWHIATAVFIAPFILLAPLNGCINNGLPRRWVMVGSAAYTLMIVALFAAGQWPWMVGLGVVALGSAIYSPARYAMLPAVAADARIPLPRVNGWIEMGGASAIIGGVALGWAVVEGPLHGYSIPVLLGLNLLSLVTALPAAFPSDVRRPEPPARALADFFRDCVRIGRERVAAGSLLGLACFQALVTAGSGAIVEHTLGRELRDGLLQALGLSMVGAGLGCLTAAWQGHPRRSLGLVPLGAVGLLLALAWVTMLTESSAEGLPLVPCFVLGFMGGLVNVPLRAAYQAAVPADARGNGMAVMNTVIYVIMTALALFVFCLIRSGVLRTPVAQLGLLAVLAAVGAAVAWWYLYPQAVEQMLEILLTSMYRVRIHGPGCEQIPRTGPLLIVANHAAYLDPFWLAKIVPRHVRPMMTSLFYDLPFIRWSMVHIVGAIRVPAAGFRREAPELREAAAVLRQGGCVLIFPEAQLRRREDQPLRLFGQGVWRILQELPQTPVLVCWIEGGWGSFTSYYNGTPLQGKRLDVARRINIAIESPRPIDPTILADQHATRQYLMRTCLECRRYLGLPVPAAEGKAANKEFADRQ